MTKETKVMMQVLALARQATDLNQFRQSLEKAVFESVMKEVTVQSSTSGKRKGRPPKTASVGQVQAAPTEPDLTQPIA